MTGVGPAGSAIPSPPAPARRPRFAFARSVSNRRVCVFLLGDTLLVGAALLIAAALRFDGAIPADTAAQLPLAAALNVCAIVAGMGSQGVYALNWAQVGLEDVVAVFRGVTWGSALFALAVVGLKHTPALAGFPRSVLLMDYIIALIAAVAFRLGPRLYEHVTHPYQSSGRRALIVGAGPAAEQIARSLRYARGPAYVPAGFLSDDPEKQRTVIHGLPVLGDRHSLPRIVREHRIDALLIATRSGTSRLIRSLVSSAREAGVREIRILGGPDAISGGQVTFNDLREVEPADLLGREAVHIDTASVATWLRGRTVLITGAAGSIGAELCRQIARFRPGRLALLDFDETELFHVEQEMQRLGHRPVTLLADVRHRDEIRDAFVRLRPHIVFHAAAYKHVGLMERHPEQAMSVNVLGTRNVAAAAADAGAETFVLISTDKAVNPTSVMGASKRAAEQVCLAWNRCGPTRYVAVRFGNVLGSRGSVVPLFQDKIRRGEPLTIRGSNMRRYFMSVSEAVLLVLQAGAVGEGGEVFVLDMGEPVHIVDLARDMIRLSGLEPDTDVPIVLTEPEPGEKEHEDLLAAEEGTTATRHERIFVAPGTVALSPEGVMARLSALEAELAARDLRRIIETVRALVPTYRPSDLVLSETAPGALNGGSPRPGSGDWRRPPVRATADRPDRPGWTSGTSGSPH